MRSVVTSFLLFLVLGLLAPTQAQELPETIRQIKPSIVGIGTYLPTRQPRSVLSGTGFVVADGLHVVTNAHVVAQEIETLKKEEFVVFVGSGRFPDVRKVKLVAKDDRYDLALLKLMGSRLPALQIGDSNRVREGKQYAFTGFPIGAILGLYPATHRGIVSAISPTVIPAHNSGQLSAEIINRLKNPFNIFQLDATAYPGNSGSPLYDPETGRVYGVINKVFVKQGKEAAISNPSGISYAIPSEYILNLLDQAGIAR